MLRANPLGVTIDVLRTAEAPANRDLKQLTPDGVGLA